MEEIFKIKSMLFATLSEISALEKKLENEFNGLHETISDLSFENDMLLMDKDKPVSVVTEYKKPEGTKNDFKQKQIDFKALIGKAGREMESCKTQYELKKVFQKYNEQLKTSTKYSALAKKNWERCSN